MINARIKTDTFLTKIKKATRLSGKIVSIY